MILSGILSGPSIPSISQPFNQEIGHISVNFFDKFPCPFFVAAKRQLGKSKLKSKTMDDVNRDPSDPIFDELFPYHAGISGQAAKFMKNTIEDTLGHILGWAEAVLEPQRRDRTMSKRLNLDLELFTEGIRKVALEPLDNFDDELEQLAEILKHAHTLFDEINREIYLFYFTNAIMKMDLTNILARYLPPCLADDDFCLESYNRVAPHALHIYEQVHLEAKAFQEWQYKIQYGNSPDVSQDQPCRLWNDILVDVVIHARDIYGSEDFPDPLSLESIIRILGDAHTRHANVLIPDQFIGIERFHELNDMQLAATLAEDLWTLECRYKELGHLGAEYDIEDLKAIISEVIGKNFSHFKVSISGKMLAAWKKDDNNHDIRIEYNYRDDDDDDDLFADVTVGTGVPRVEVLNGHLIMLENDASTFEDKQWDVDVGFVRGQAIVEWEEEIRRQPHQDGDEPPLYSESFNDIPPRYGDDELVQRTAPLDI